MKVVVINYGMGNLGSVARALEECGATVEITENPTSLVGAERIVLPGVGAFPDAMARLEAARWPGELSEALSNPEVRLLGICLGMQLLADKGHEVAETAGLGLIPGEVVRLVAGQGERVPHVGWNEVRHRQVVGSGNVFGTQFHPEKSSRPGMQLLKNFLARPGC